ncbi:ATP-binding cassette domain-containing protein [Pseudoduganella sp. FT26W]|uniref:ATP-binding cassette domain-containing protein n=1 Tax=Duganella aquatilis TaxID=2666082 RepID=A0A844DCJ2_9BURK|nr:ATP-binding cassette domain-containing protein [Duganella aquatilis]MRW85279.1 ATP-binding cassette domain-containing protein [Duganella aquatilis]
MIEVNNLNKSFGKLRALNNVSFKAGNGSITCMLGPNGAGKTSLLRTLLGLMPRDSGTVYVDGIDPAANAQTVRASIGFLPDQVGLYDRLTAREYLTYFARLGGMDQQQAQARVAEVAALFDIETLLSRRTIGFSQGERMRVSLARATLARPQNLILDEPTRGLDVMSTRTLRKALLSLRASGCCILLSTHIMQEVAQLSDHIIVMARGTVIASGSQQQLRQASDADDLEDAFVNLVATAEMECA